MFKPSLVAAALVCLCATVIHAKDVEPSSSVVPSQAELAVSGVSGHAVPRVEAESRWEVRASDVTLSRTLERWALAAGHKLKWDASRNFLIGAPDVYVGSFEGALEHLLSSPGIRFSDFPLEACLYTNTPPLVRITRQGEQSRECAAATAR
jgi:hypothetical protein